VSLTREVRVVNEFGESRDIAIPAERDLTVYVDKRELVTLMTLGGHPEWLVLGYLRNQRLVDSVHDIESITVDWEVGAAAVKTRRGVDHRINPQHFAVHPAVCQRVDSEHGSLALAQRQQLSLRNRDVGFERLDRREHQERLIRGHHSAGSYATLGNGGIDRRPHHLSAGRLLGALEVISGGGELKLGLFKRLP
jgi:formate dehydrogenase assembly factor FdhD